MRNHGAALVTAVLLAVFVSVDSADANGRRKPEFFTARLVGFNEVPSLSTPTRGWLRVKIDGDVITYWLSYDHFESDVTQAHLHLGQRHTNGGISAFLCTNLGNGPAGTPACPAGRTVVQGEISAEHVVGPAGQGISAGELAELVEAIRSGAVYGNVHTTTYPGGEIRGQLAKF